MVLIGAGGHSRSCIDVIEQQGKYQIAGLVGLPEQVGIQQFGYSVMASDDALTVLAKTHEFAIITIGQTKTAEHRVRLYMQAVRCGFKLPVIISPSAQVSRHATIGSGSIVMHRAIINAGASVGANCIINSSALVEHDTTVDDHCHVSTGAILNGGVTVGACSFVGSGCVIKQEVSIGNGCVVGMGVSVRHNLTDYSRFKGY